VRILIGGSSGLVGTALSASLQADGHETVALVRRPVASEGGIEWHPPREPEPAERLEGFDAVVHLGGRNLATWPWTAGRKRSFRSSRIDSTASLARAMAGASRPPNVFVVASAIGIYGSRGDERLTEDSTPGDDFLARLVVDWEAAATPARDAGIRTVHARFGVVLSTEGGALAAMLPPFRLGLGARLGSGRQWMSWVTLQDVVRAIRFAIDTPTLSGPVNVVAGAVTNADFTRSLGHALGRPTPFVAPGPVLRLVGGEMVRQTVLASQRVESNRLATAGFDFEDTDLSLALARRTESA
jgi:hypothetical protein